MLVWPMPDIAVIDIHALPQRAASTGSAVMEWPYMHFVETCTCGFYASKLAPTRARARWAKQLQFARTLLRFRGQRS